MSSFHSEFSIQILKQLLIFIAKGQENNVQHIPRNLQSESQITVLKFRLSQSWCVQYYLLPGESGKDLPGSNPSPAYFEPRKLGQVNLTLSLVFFPSCSLISSYTSTYLIPYLCSCQLPTQCLLLSYSTRPPFLKHQLKLLHSLWWPLAFNQFLNIYWIL